MTIDPTITDETSKSPTIQPENIVTDDGQVIETISSDENLLALTKLQKEHDDLKEICKKAQNDYIMLKIDFDQYQNRIQSQQKDAHTQSLIDVVKKILPCIDILKKSLDTVGTQEDNPLIQGIRMTYESFLKVLDGLYIFPIISLGQKPDSLLHEPIGSVPATDDSQKGCIVSELQQGFVYEYEGTKKVVQSAKVMIGQ